MMRNKIFFIVALITLLFIAYFTFLSFQRHDNYYSKRVDLGNMDQTVWNVKNGNGFLMTDPFSDRQESRLAVHADFLLILLAPFYYLWSNPKTLLLIQTIIIGLGVIPVYWITKEKLKSEKLALLFSIAYLLYPPTQRILLHDFHAVSLSTTFLLFTYWYLHKNNYLLFSLFALLSALGKEDMWLITGIMGIYIFLIKKRRLLGFITALISFSVFYLLMWNIIPSLTINNQHFALGYLAEFTGDQKSVVFGIFSKPYLIIQKIISTNSLFYLFQLLLPVIFLPLFSPGKLIFALPVIAVNLLSSNDLMRRIDYQYNSGITPFIFISAVDGYLHVINYLKKQKVWINRMPYAVYRKPYTITRMPYAVYRIPYAVCISAVFLSSCLWGELPLEKESRYAYFLSVPKTKELMDKVIAEIGPKYTVSATNNIGAHLSQRKILYNYPVHAESSDYTLIQLEDPNAWPSEHYQKEVLQKLFKNKGYILIAQKENFYAFRKKGI